MSDDDFTDRLSALAEQAARTGTLGPAADVRRRGDQRRRRQHTLTGALGAVVLLGALGTGIALGQKGHTPKPGPAAVSTAVSRPPWSGTKQFMQVQSGQAGGGTVTLKVRPAKKVVVGESFETQPIPGPYSEVTVRADARILSLDGESGAPGSFVDALGRRTAQQRAEAFDVTFDATGEVTLIEWLYAP